MLEEINRINKKQIMWYPSSGSDFRPIHNCNFNNFFIEIKTYFFNDISEYINTDLIEKIDEITLESQTNEVISVGAEKFQYQKMIFIVNFPNRKTKKTVYYFPKTTNQEMLKLIQKIKCVSVLLLHRCCSVPESKSWVEIAKDLKIKYLFSDNWFTLTQNDENMRVKELISENNLQLISKNSYFRGSNSLSKNTTLNSNQLFDSFIYLFQIKQNGKQQ